jgi:hypothetical protein
MPAHLLLPHGKLGNAPGVPCPLLCNLLVLPVEPLLQLPSKLPAQSQSQSQSNLGPRCNGSDWGRAAQCGGNKLGATPLMR